MSQLNGTQQGGNNGQVCYAQLLIFEIKQKNIQPFYFVFQIILPDVNLDFNATVDCNISLPFLGTVGGAGVMDFDTSTRPYHTQVLYTGR